MIKVGSKIKIRDNSGAKIVKCFHLGKKTTRLKSYGTIGDICLGSIKKYIPSRKVKKKEIWKVLIILIKKKMREKDGSYISYNENVGIILDRTVNKPLGNRIKVRISLKFKRSKLKRNWLRLRSIAKGYI